MLEFIQSLVLIICFCSFFHYMRLFEKALFEIKKDLDSKSEES